MDNERIADTARQLLDDEMDACKARMSAIKQALWILHKYPERQQTFSIRIDGAYGSVTEGISLKTKAPLEVAIKRAGMKFKRMNGYKKHLFGEYSVSLWFFNELIIPLPKKLWKKYIEE